MKKSYLELLCVISLIIFLAYSILGYIYGVRGGLFGIHEYVAFLFALLTIELAVIAIIQTIKTDKAIDTISVESHYVENPWLEGAKMVESATSGCHLLALNLFVDWSNELPGVEEYKRANQQALKKGAYITRIFSFPKDIRNKELLNTAIEQSKWKPPNIKILVYDGEDALMDYAIIEKNGEPISAVLWLHDPLHEFKPLPGFMIKNKKLLIPLWQDFVRRLNNTISLDDYIRKIENKYK